jgi:hypothetical protein
MNNQLKSLPKLPGLPKMTAVNRCECGCRGLTGNRFVPGHDSKLNARIKRVNAGVFDPTNPANVIAQLDAATNWLTVSEVEAMAAAMRVEWTKDAWLKRADAADATATGTEN